MSDLKDKTFSAIATANNARPYVISTEDAKIVDFAIKLGKPLLVEGEAGCGKSQLAKAIATELGLQLITLPIRSTSRANDLLYRFDALRRLQDSQVKGRQEKAAWAHNYIRLQPLGRAILDSQLCVVLIDEIDKADRDFANDLLHVLDQFEFPIDEIPDEESNKAYEDTQELRSMVKSKGDTRPIVVFTSNRENPLPLPFLRRCTYLELKFPEDPKLLAEIVELNLRDKLNISKDIVQQAVATFMRIRRQAESNNAIKKPATAELIDWVHALHWEPQHQDQIDSQEPPYWKLLFRSATDIEAFEQSLKTSN